MKLDCDLIMQDDEAAQFLVDAGIDADTMCGCVLELAVAGTEEEREQAYLAFSRIAEIIRDTGAGVEDTVSKLQDDAALASNDEDQQMLLAGIDLTETYFERIGSNLSETGQCSVGGD